VEIVVRGMASFWPNGGKKASSVGDSAFQSVTIQEAMKRVGIILGVVLLLIVGIGGYQFFARQQATSKANAEASKSILTVSSGDLNDKVIETGTIDAVKSVELKSRVSGRLKRLLVDEGDFVKQGQLVALIDPQETELQLRQNQAQLRGAQSSVTRAGIEIEQRRINVRASLRQAELRVAQLRNEVRIQPTLTRSTVISAQTTYDSAKAEIVRLETTAHPNQRTATETALREANANFENARAEFDRQSELLRQGYVSQKVVENAQLSLDLARVRRDQAMENANRLEKQLRIELARAKDDLRRAEAELNRARANAISDVTKRQEFENAVADLEKSRAALRDVDALNAGRAQSQASVDQLSSVVQDGQRQLGETEIRAPMDGIVAKRYMQEGELVSGLSSFNAGTPIVKVEDRGVMRVLLNVNEIDTTKLRLGVVADITIDALADTKFKGEVRKISPASTTSTVAGATGGGSAEQVVKYAVEVYLSKPDDRIRTGMSAKCEMTVDGVKGKIVVPLEYLSKDKDKWFVQPAPEAPGKPVPPQKEVTVGLQSGASVEVKSGLTVGDKLAKPKFTGPDRAGFMGGGPDDGDGG
jgi:HlyD family secretion protein